jgi:hypothetical protein
VCGADSLNLVAFFSTPIVMGLVLLGSCSTSKKGPEHFLPYLPKRKKKFFFSPSVFVLLFLSKFFGPFFYLICFLFFLEFLLLLFHFLLLSCRGLMAFVKNRVSFLLSTFFRRGNSVTGAG